MICYTAIFGKYDNLKTPTVVTEGWKYVCFTNNKELKSDFWDIRYIENKNLSNVKAARCIKIRFFDYVKDDLSIWCDASTQINVDLNEFVKVYHRGNFTTTQHPVRNCVYQEAYACMKLNKDNNEVIHKQMLGYFNEKMPQHFGMIQSGLMIRNRDKEVIAFCTEWFKEVKKHSCRDQLSFNYVLWKTKLIKPYLITGDIFKNEFKLYRHTS